MPDETEDQQFEETSEGFRQLREAHKRSKAEAKEAREAAASAEAVKRENAMLRAGVDLDSPVGKLFAKGYDGELDPDAVKSAWSEIGVTPTPSESQETVTEVDDGPTEAEQEQQRLRGVLTSDATPPGSEPSPDPWDEAIGEFHDRQKRGQTKQRAQTAALQHVLNAAVAGDKRVLFDREDWKRSFES